MKEVPPAASRLGVRTWNSREGTEDKNQDRKAGVVFIPSDSRGGCMVELHRALLGCWVGGGQCRGLLGSTARVPREGKAIGRNEGGSQKCRDSYSRPWATAWSQAA